MRKLIQKLMEFEGIHPELTLWTIMVVVIFLLVSIQSLDSQMLRGSIAVLTFIPFVAYVVFVYGPRKKRD